MIFYQDIAKFVSLRAKQIVDGDATARKTAYASTTIETQLDGTEIPWGALKQDVLATEREVAAMIGLSNNPQFRRSLMAESANVADKGTIPIDDANGFKFLGTFDAVIDGTNSNQLTEQPKQIVLSRIENPGTFFKRDCYHYCFEGTQVRHTRTNVKFRGCSWDYTTQSALFDAATGTPANKSFVSGDVNTTTDETALVAHGFFTGLRVRLTTTVTLPGGLALATDYYLIVNTIDSLAFATSATNALNGVRIDLTSIGTGTHTITPQQGGSSPLPQELAVLWGCKVLEQLPQEDWFIPEAGYYGNLVQSKQSEIIEGKIALMQMPAMPVTTARVDPVKD